MYGKGRQKGDRTVLAHPFLLPLNVSSSPSLPSLSRGGEEGVRWGRSLLPSPLHPSPAPYNTSYMWSYNDTMTDHFSVLTIPLSQPFPSSLAILPLTLLAISAPLSLSVSLPPFIPL